LSLLYYDFPHVNTQKKFGKKCFLNLQGTMYHRPLTNTSSLKIAAAYVYFMQCDPYCDTLGGIRV
jgi:hypothetical protein